MNSVLLEGAQSKQGQGWRLSYFPLAGHPWTAAGDWDICMVETLSQEELTARIEKAEQQFWQVWLRGGCEGTTPVDYPFGAVLFKPHRANRPWQDSGPKSETHEPIWLAH